MFTNWTELLTEHQPPWWFYVLLLVLIANGKSLPGSWTVQTLYYLLTSVHRTRRQRRTALPEINSDEDKRTRPGVLLLGGSASQVALSDSKPSPPPQSSVSAPTRDGLQIALFRPTTLRTRLSLFEIDYNLHKSN